MEAIVVTTQESALRIRGALARWFSATAEWVDATWELAHALYDARQLFPSNQTFGAWLGENELDQINSNDRAALIKFVEHEKVARVVLEETDRRSPQWIWHSELRPRLTHASNTDQKPVAETEAPIVTVEAGQSSNGTEPEDKKSETSKAPRPKWSDKKKATHPVLKRPDGEKIWTHYLQTNSHKILRALARSKKKDEREVLDLITECIDNGAFGEPTHASIHAPSLRLALPWAPSAFAKSFDLTNPDQRAIVRRHILPVVLEHRERLRERPDDLPGLVEQKRRATIDARKEQQAVAKLKPGEAELIAYGQRIWPTPGIMEQYTYDNALHAIWWVTFTVMNYSPSWNAASRALQMRQSVKMLAREISKGCMRAIHQVITAYENNPEQRSIYPRVPNPSYFDQE